LGISEAFEHDVAERDELERCIAHEWRHIV
jgi:hypothetical protein